jgi:Xaa-Pro aminopeptidase
VDGHTFAARHRLVADAIRQDNLDALVVTNSSNIRYLTGFAGSAGLLVVTPERLYLLVDFRYSAAVDGLVRAGVAPASLEPVRLEGSAGYDRRFSELVAEQGWRTLGFESVHVSVARWRTWQHALASTPHESTQHRSTQHKSTQPKSRLPVALVETTRVIERLRRRKDAAEIAVLREAAQRLSTVARDVLGDAVRPGRTEVEVAAEIDARLVDAGFEKPAFDTIVASGPNSALPHAHPTRRTLASGDLVVIDFGGVHEGYCVDLTRTVAIGSVNPDCRRLYQAVHEAHAAAIDLAGRPGALTGEVDAAARDVLRQHTLDQHFGHGTGHGLGLDVHEEPRLSRRSADTPGDDPIEPGMVFTIEPGVYVEGLGGVRIEDDVLATADGCEVLTDVPREWRQV